MKRIGLVGGAGWRSTIEYYRHLNEISNSRLGGQENGLVHLVSMNFGELIRNSHANNFAANGPIALDAAKRLKASGAECLLLCANSLHVFVDMIRAETGLPVPHIADATSAAIQRAGLKRVGLLGTKYTMMEDVYHSILARTGIECVVPEEGDRAFVHGTILKELADGDFSQTMKDGYLAVIERLRALGAEGVILGCTEIPLLLRPEEIPMPSFDTTYLHAKAAVEFALA